MLFKNIEMSLKDWLQSYKVVKVGRHLWKLSGPTLAQAGTPQSREPRTISRWFLKILQ